MLEEKISDHGSAKKYFAEMSWEIFSHQKK